MNKKQEPKTNKVKFKGKTVIPIFVIRNGYFQRLMLRLYTHIHKTLLVHTFRSKIDIERKKKKKGARSPRHPHLTLFPYYHTHTRSSSNLCSSLLQNLGFRWNKMNLFRKKTSPKGTMFFTLINLYICLIYIYLSLLCRFPYFFLIFYCLVVLWFWFCWALGIQMCVDICLFHFHFLIMMFKFICFFFVCVIYCVNWE